jgi:asparagine synthase (glutamine-hydrolysing)
MTLFGGAVGTSESQLPGTLGLFFPDAGKDGVWMQGCAGIGAESSLHARLDSARGVTWVGSVPPTPDGPSAYRVGNDCSAIAVLPPDRLLLSRGRFGGRPLYHALVPGPGACLASSRLAPLAAAVRARTPDVEWLSAYVADLPLADQSRTPYQGVSRVPSSTTLLIGHEGIRQRTRMPFDARPRRSAPVETLAAELREVILRSVARAVGDSPEVAVLVSGGLDSSGVLAAAIRVARERGQRVRVFTLDFAGIGDDRPHLAALCSMYGIEPVKMRPRDCGTTLRETLLIDDLPVENPVGPSMARVLRAHGVSRVLTGEGGDDVFGGDERIFLDRALRGHPLDAVVRAAHLQAFANFTTWSRVSSLVLRPTLRRLLPRPPRAVTQRLRRRQWPSWAGSELKRVLAGSAVGAHDMHWDESPRERCYLEHLSWSNFYVYVSDTRAQMELVGGFLRADPLLDDEVVDFMASLAPEQLFHAGWVRGLYREALRGWVPESLRLRPDKADFEPALLELAGGETGLRSLAPLAGCRHLADLGLADPRKFQVRFERLMSQPMEGALWLEVLRVLSAEAFLERLEVGPS